MPETFETVTDFCKRMDVARERLSELLRRCEKVALWLQMADRSGRYLRDFLDDPDCDWVLLRQSELFTEMALRLYDSLYKMPKMEEAKNVSTANN